MEQQEAVNEPVEQTTPVESATIETQATDTSNTPADASIEQKQVSESVPRDRLNQVIEERNALREQLAQFQARTQPHEDVYTLQETENPFDEATTTGVLTLAEQAANAAWEKREAEKWVKQHSDDLKDPIVDSRTKDLIRQGYDRDAALSQAKKELNERITPIQKEALAQGVQEGQNLAQEKSKMGAVGTPGSSGKIDPSKLSSAEFAKFYGLNRV